MKKLKIAEWHTNLAWYIASCFATGFLFYFLSKDNYLGASVSAVLAVVFACVAVWLHRSRDKITLPIYNGHVNHNLTQFLNKHSQGIFRLELVFNEEDSQRIVNWLSEKNTDPMIWFSAAHDEDAAEYGFNRTDNEIHWNNRFLESVHTEGYFKVASTQGPYQGVMSVVLKGVGKEHLPGTYS